MGEVFFFFGFDFAGCVGGPRELRVEIEIVLFGSQRRESEAREREA